MPAAVLHLPLDFERLESVRLLSRKLTGINELQGELAALYAFRVWSDWGVSGKQYRPLQNKPPENAREHDWSRENITFVLEDAAKWNGKTGELLLAMLDAGLLVVAEDPATSTIALTLDGFWRLNDHLAPGYKSIQRLGADAANTRRALGKMNDLASQQRKVFERQGFLPFGEEAPTEQEQEACYALFLRLHRECAIELPQADEFTQAAMLDALRIIRTYTPTQIAAVEQYVIEHAQDVEFVKKPARILENFRELLSKTGKADA